MPLLIFDVIEGRSERELTTLLDAAHRAVIHALRCRSAIATRLFTKTKLTIW